MASGANDVDIVVGLKASTYTAGMREIKKSLADLDTQTKAWSSHTVTNAQAASAGVRLLENPLGNQLRALEKLISTSKVLSGAFQAAFPVVGMIAAGSMLFKLGTEVAEFIKKTQEMPRNLELGFRALNQSAMLADDMLKVTNDKLDDQIAKIEHKPSRNGQALALDEARVAADKYADALARDQKSFEAVAKENAPGFFAQLMGKDSTAGVTNSVDLYNRKMGDLSSQNQIALHDGDKGLSKDLTKQMADLTDAEKQRLKADIAMRTGKVTYTQGDTGEVSRLDYAQIHGDQTSPLTIDRYALSHLDLRQETQKDESANGTKQGQLVDAQTAAEANRTAAEASRKAAEAMARGWAEDAELFKKWQDYEAENTKISQEDYREKSKNNFLSSDDTNQLNQSGAGSLARITAMRQSIDVNKQNSDALAQQSIEMGLATGQLTKLDAARMQAAIHTQEYTAALQKLQEQAEYIKGDKSYTSEEARQAALTNNQTAQGQLNVNRQVQSDQDNQSINPAPTSALVGATNALDEFVIASQDAAAQMQELATNTLKGLNDTILHVLTTPHMTGQQTRAAFGDYGAGLAKSVAGTALQKGEGSVLGAFGFGGGKLGTKTNPMYVTSADKYQPGSGGVPGAGGGSQSGFLGMANKMFGTSLGDFGGGGAQGPGYDGLDDAQGISQHAFQSDQDAGGLATEASDTSDLGDIGAFAYGGAIDGPAIVGEQGPELFIPQGQGNITPNHQLKNMGGGGHTINIDATGSTDPAQTRAQVMSGIRAASPHISASTISAQREQNRRSPSSLRK